jgi:hypothetical protein
MSALLRLSRTLRTPRTTKTTQKMSSHFFFPCPTPGLPRARFYSPGGGSYRDYRLQETNNLAVLYTLMGTNIAIFGYAMYVKQQAMVRDH